MKSLLFLLCMLAVSWHLSDLDSPKMVDGVLAPFAFIFAVAGIVGWLALRLGFSSNRSGGEGYTDWSGGGGDCGGGD